jgi:prepilin-type N-terminal cleavage/methylation domain-containing protein
VAFVEAVWERHTGQEDEHVQIGQTACVAGPCAPAGGRGDERGFTLIETMIALAILAWVSVALIGTVTLVEKRNRDAYAWAVAHMGAHHTLAELEATALVNDVAGLQAQNNASFTIEDASYVVEEGIAGGHVVSGEGRIFVYDLSQISVANGGWDHGTAGQVFLIRVSVDVDNDGDWNAQLDQVDIEDVNVYGVAVF